MFLNLFDSSGKLDKRELKKACGYRKIDDGEVLVDVEEIHLGCKLIVEVKGKIDSFELFKFPRPEKLLINNWQSWGPAKVIRRDFRLNFPKELIEKFGFSASIMPEKYFNTLISDYFIASDNFVIGTLSSIFGHQYFELNDEYVSAQCNYFGKVFQDWTRIESIVLLNVNPDIGLPYFADLIAKENVVNFKRTNPLGWSSWYQYFLDFDYEKMLSDLEKSRNKGFEVFQIDDAWERDIGDWISNEKFPPINELSNKIKEFGYTPGIWLAPFSVSETSEFFKQHPDWVVKDDKGQPIVAYENWNKKIYALDTTHPEAQQWLSNLFKTLKDVGFDYFKIDFLFAGAIQGKRYDDVTPIEAYRKGLKLIRETVGDSFILGCGAPLLPSVGLVDGMRISADTAPFWDVNGPDIGYPNAYFSLRNVITRSFFNSVLWWNDPDCLLLRKEDTNLTDEQRKLYTYVSLMLDNMIIQSDNLSLNIDNDLWEFARKYKAFGRRIFKVEGLLDERYTITSCGLNGCDKLEILDLENANYNLHLDSSRIILIKNVEKRSDGRIFNYYVEREV